MAFPADWSHKKTITLSGAYSAGIVQFRVYAGTGTDAPSTKAFYLGGNAALPDYRDIRFADSADTLLIHNIRRVAKDGSFAIVQVRTNATVAADQELSCYVGNADATDISDPADVAIFGDRFIPTDGGLSRQCAIYDASVSCGTHIWQRIAYRDGLFDVVTMEDIGTTTYDILLRKYNPKDGLFSLPHWIGSSKAKDYHNYGTSVIDSVGTSHVFYGCHNTQLYYNRVTEAGVKGTEQSITGATDASYPQPLILPNDTIYVFFRSGSSYSGVVKYSKSTNGGVTWSAPVTVFQEGTESTYFTVNISADGSTIHLAVSVRLYNLDASSDFYDIDYAKMSTSTDAWSKADGTALTLPISRATSDRIETGAGYHISSIAIHPDTGAAYIAYAYSTATSGYFEDSAGKIATWNGGAWAKETAISTGDGRYHWQLHIESDAVFRLVNLRRVAGVDEAYVYVKSGGAWDSGTPLSSGSATNGYYSVVPKDAGSPFLCMWSQASNILYHGTHAAKDANQWTLRGTRTLRGANIYLEAFNNGGDRRATANIAPGFDWDYHFDVSQIGSAGADVFAITGLSTHDENYQTTVTSAASDGVYAGMYGGNYRVYALDGTSAVVASSPTIAGPAQSDVHYCTLARRGSAVTLAIYTDEDRSAQVTGSPLSIDLTGKTIAQLNYLHIGNRTTSGTTYQKLVFDNIYLTDPETATVSAFGSWEGDGGYSITTTQALQIPIATLDAVRQQIKLAVATALTTVQDASLEIAELVGSIVRQELRLEIRTELEQVQALALSIASETATVQDAAVTVATAQTSSANLSLSVATLLTSLADLELSIESVVSSVTRQDLHLEIATELAVLQDLRLMIADMTDALTAVFEIPTRFKTFVIPTRNKTFRV